MTFFNSSYKGSTFKSIAAKLRFAFAVTSALLFLIILFFYWFDKRDSHLEEVYSHLERINLKVERAGNLEKRFLLEETINPSFYKTGRSPYIDKHRQLLEDIKADLLTLQQVGTLKSTHIYSDIDSITLLLGTFTNTFDALVNKTLERGFKDDGYEGKMRNAIRGLMGSKAPLDMVKLLSLRRHEKDYMLRKDQGYVKKLQQVIGELQVDFRQFSYPNEDVLEEQLEAYERYFLKLVAADKELGLSSNEGLAGRLSMLSEQIESALLHTSQEVRNYANETRYSLELGIIVLSLVCVLLNFLLSLFTTRSLSKPIEELSTSIHQIASSDFTKEVEVGHSHRRDEIGKLSKDFNFMLDSFREHTINLKNHQQQTSLALANIARLSKMGQQLASTLQIKEILDISFDSLQKLMDVSIVWVGLHRKERDELEYYGIAQGEKHLNTFTQSLKDKERKLGAWCFVNQKEVIIDDYSTVRQQYQGFESATGEFMQTVVYLPLTSGGKEIGVLGVQHQEPQAFSEMDVDVLKGFASYLVIALDNALIYEGLELTIQERTAEVEAQKEYLEVYARKMSASINYAKRIQEALLPNMDKVREALPQSFVLFKPRDIVSGDFFWFSEQGDKLIIAALDCTGHGVPGAFMSMIGNELLNEAIIGMNIFKPEEILYHVHKGIRRDLRQYETGNRDGIDMSICVLDKATNTLSFSGAKSPLAYVKDGELYMLKGDVFPVGGEQREVRRTFTAHQLNLEREMQFYMFSDGYQDQFGGVEGRKFMKKAFKKLLLEISNNELESQKAILEKRLAKWMGSKYAQLDDVLVIGFKL